MFVMWSHFEKVNITCASTINNALTRTVKNNIININTLSSNANGNGGGNVDNGGSRRASRAPCRSCALLSLANKKSR